MPPTKSSKTAGPLKQAKLSFASKRTTSANPAAGKTAKATHKQPARTPSSPLSTAAPIVLSDSDRDGSLDDEGAAPVPKKRRLNSGRRKQEQEVPSKDEGDTEAVAAEPEREPAREPLKLSDKRWRKLYGAARERMDYLEPVHANGQSMVHHILRVFDLSYEYGPCVGVSRLQRWERANVLGLNPPPEVKEILMTKEGSAADQFSQSVFHDEV